MCYVINTKNRVVKTERQHTELEFLHDMNIGCSVFSAICFRDDYGRQFSSLPETQISQLLLHELP